MYLKRGLRRQSCDFCFRRKVRCDRLTRRAGGHSQCSHCELRELPCIAESSSGSHSQRSTDSIMQHHLTPIPCGPGSRQNADHSSRPLTSPTDTIVVGSNIISPPLSTPAPYSASTYVPPLADDTATDFAWQEIGWELGTESISFLDSIFTQNNSFDIMTEVPLVEEGGEIGQASQSPYETPGADLNTLDEAIEAYFDLASLAVPILSREAFMVDYKSNRASHALVYAVACRGSPFTSEMQKWAGQQHLASQFRQRFLEARLAAENDQSIMLDDLEALALMIEFPYETTEDSTTMLQSQLGNLFLTHDSLVLMTLQYRILGHRVQLEGSSEPLHGAEDRKRLLFWHVYGTDAFRTLDKKIPSRIRDRHVDLPEKPAHEERTYLDCILSLAIIARKTLQIFPGVTIGTISALHEDVASLYNQLAEWRRTLPSHLQSCTKKGNSSSSQYDSAELSRAYPLQPAVLLFLEHNCYLQIEACASKCGINKSTSMEAAMLSHLIEYKTLKTTKSITDLLPWLQSQKIKRKSSAGETAYSLVDLVPSILRNMCAGTCYWLSDRGKRLLNCNMPIRPASVEMQGGTTHEKGCSTEAAGNFLKGAVTLRDAVATASSHMDTLAMVEQLDKQISSLKKMIEDADND